MAYTTIPDSDIDTNSPITVALMSALRDNLTAVLNNEAGAPKVTGISLGVLVPGTTVRARADALIDVAGNGNAGVGAWVNVWAFTFVQHGVVIFSSDFQQKFAGRGNAQLVRVRSGSALTLYYFPDTTAWVDIDIAVTVQPGDQWLLQARATNFYGPNLQNIRILTDGGELWDTAGGKREFL
jgi:uncharacterized protein (DUF697 family)